MRKFILVFLLISIIYSCNKPAQVEPPIPVPPTPVATCIDSGTCVNVSGVIIDSSVNTVAPGQIFNIYKEPLGSQGSAFLGSGTTDQQGKFSINVPIKKDDFQTSRLAVHIKLNDGYLPISSLNSYTHLTKYINTYSPYNNLRFVVWQKTNLTINIKK